MIKADIPKGNIIFDTKSNNSWDEAVNTFKLMKEKDWKSVIVVSDPPHLLRVWWAWSKVFRKSSLHFMLAATNPEWWNAWKWWANEKSCKWVVSEYLKAGYFVYKYHFGGKNTSEALKVDKKVRKEWDKRIDTWLDKIKGKRQEARG